MTLVDLDDIRAAAHRVQRHGAAHAGAAAAVAGPGALNIPSG